MQNSSNFDGSSTVFSVTVKLPSQLWLYPTSTDRPWMISCCRSMLKSHRKSRLSLTVESSKTTAEGLNVPKLTLLIGPQTSPPEPLRSCALKFFTSQSGMKLLLLSVHVRLALLIDELKGWKRIVKSARLNWLNRPSDVRSAVRPLPNTSNAAPIRGLMSVHDGMPYFASA